MSIDLTHDFAANAAGSNEAGTIVDIALAAAEPKELAAGLIALTVPAGGGVEIVDVEERLAKHMDQPSRATGVHVVATVKSFSDLVSRHEDDQGRLAIFVHPTSGAIAAVLNDHGRGQDPQWGDHRVQLRLTHTEAWERWTKLDGHLTDQEAFAEHIQDGITEIAHPSGAELLEIAQTMQGTTTAAWKAGVRLSDGAVTIGYAEEVSATAGRDQQLSIPTEFHLLLAPFIGEEPVQIAANLRWRIREGKLRLGYKLANPQLVLQTALEKIASRLGDEFPGNVYLGEPRR